MKLEKRLQKQQYDELWQEYCGFLDLNIDEYMNIQNRLMLEQIELWSQCGLGKKLLRGQRPKTVDEFRKMLPLTSYADYADVLLSKQTEMLPAEPVVWIQTTWEGGNHPIKLAPYTKCMLDVYQKNVVSALILATSTERGKFTAKPNDKTLFGLAPLPYATGLFPLLLNEEISLRFLPPVEEALQMSFGERNKKGFEMGMHKGIDMFFGLSSVISYITECFDDYMSKGKGSSLNLFSYSPTMIRRFLRASYKSKRDEVPIKPKDIFKLKGFVCAGTDTKCYKRFLEEAWGCKPMEIAAGTEPTCIGTETWARNGLIFFPDACFYEFIPEPEMYKSIDNCSYEPKTYLMDELIPNHNYELVISVLKGGAFARYRVGDVYRCLNVSCNDDGVMLPRLVFVDRIPSVIDIAGFTRITEDSINDVINISGLHIYDWLAKKEFNENNRPFLHMFIELEPHSIESMPLSKQVLTEHLSIYFKYFDSDYHDLKKMLGIEPLKITILRSGTMDMYKRSKGKKIRRINPSSYDIAELLEFQQQDFYWESRGYGQ
ncbi:MAG: auxin-responsive protein [Bacillota bacterium]|jgi:hypothetical protein